MNELNKKNPLNLNMKFHRIKSLLDTILYKKLLTA